MARVRGLYEKIRAKTGLTDREIRRQAMKTVTSAARKLLEEVLGPEGAKNPGLAWFAALRLVIPVFWSLAAKKEAIPSVDEVVAEVKRKHPNYADVLKRTHTVMTTT